MGTTYSVKLAATTLDEREIELLEERLETILLQVNRQMSTYLPDSEISRFNRYQAAGWFDISDDFARVLSEAIEMSRRTGGAFDVTVGPLVNLWGFGPQERDEVPDPSAIREALESVGFEKLDVRIDPPQVRKESPHVYCDLSAIAKGFAVDKIAMELEANNMNDYLVEIGGEVRCRGHNENGERWRIGIDSPDQQRTVKRVVLLNDKCIATSGDYYNFFEKGGVSYSHTLDPRTGYPIVHGLRSVSVLHDSCMMADALATAISVMGPEEGYEFAVANQLAVLMMAGEDGALLEKSTPSMQHLFSSSGSANGPEP